MSDLDPQEFTPIIEGRTMFYVDEHADETMPCNASLEGWAAWLAAGCKWGCSEDEVANPPEDGTVFQVSSMVMAADITARWNGTAFEADGAPPADATFFVPRFGPGLGWDPESIHEELDALLKSEAELYTGDSADEVDDLLIAVGVAQPTAPYRFELRPDGARLVPVALVQ